MVYKLIKIHEMDYPFIDLKRARALILGLSTIPFIVFTVLLVVFAPNSGKLQRSTNDSDFDFLIFAQRWPVTTCSQWMDKSERNTCTLPIQSAMWTVHGVWPTKLHSKGPKYCDRNQPFDLQKLNPIESEMTEKWTNIEKNTRFGHLWKRQWEKHGTCAAKHIPEMRNEFRYFLMGLDLHGDYSINRMLVMANIKPGINASYDLEEIHAALNSTINKSFAIVCEEDKKTKQSFLKEIRICLDKKLALKSCVGIITGDVDPDDKIITNCKKGRKIVYPSMEYLWRKEFNRQVEDEKFSYGDWLKFAFSSFVALLKMENDI